MSSITRSGGDPTGRANTSAGDAPAGTWTIEHSATSASARSSAAERTAYVSGWMKSSMSRKATRSTESSSRSSNSFIVATSPRFSRLQKWMRGSSAANARTAASVPSREPSSITYASQSAQVCAWSEPSESATKRSAL